MSTTDFEQLIKWFGLPGALLIVMILLLSKGKLLWAYQVKERKEDLAALLVEKDVRLREKDNQLAHLEIEIAEQVAKMESNFNKRLDNLREEKNHWRDLAWNFQNELEKATRINEKAIDKLPPGGE